MTTTTNYGTVELRNGRSMGVSLRNWYVYSPSPYSPPYITPASQSGGERLGEGSWREEGGSLWVICADLTANL